MIIIRKNDFKWQTSRLNAMRTYNSFALTYVVYNVYVIVYMKMVKLTKCESQLY